MQVKVTLTLKDEELKKIMVKTGLIKPDEIKGYFYAREKGNIECDFGNRYDIDVRVDDTDDKLNKLGEALSQLATCQPMPFCGDHKDPAGEPSKPGVKEVKRPAKPGEYIKIVDRYTSANNYSNGDILKVKKEKKWGITPGVHVEEFPNPFIGDDEYVVLENYEPPKKPEVKEVKRQAKVGEYVKLTYDGLFEGRICKVREICSKAYELKDVVYVDIDDDFSLGYTVDEYVVLENYEPEEGEKK